MQKKIYHIIILLLLATPLVSAQDEPVTILLNKESSMTAGESLVLSFSNPDNSEVKLYCSNSYGSILVQPEIDSGMLSFKIPSEISNKSGILRWKLLGSSNPLNGEILIKSKPEVNSLESYLGPPSIEAGGKDYTTLVVIPTDDLDNALADSTNIRVKHQFLESRFSSDILTEHGIAFLDIYSKKQSGRILISSECMDLNSKEYDVNVMPAIPTNFSIDYNRVHEYADGNQITTFETSSIRDEYGNIVSDGTLVSFFITNDSGFKSKVSGSTINGIARAKVLNPNKKESWKVKAYVEGMAESNTLEMNYKQAVKDFDVAISEDQKQIKVGPLKSFMEQRIPDGFRIKLKIYKDSKLENEVIGFTKDGQVTFDINQNRYKNSTVSFVIKAAGITKTISDITYE